jgi:hypothetical protein
MRASSRWPERLPPPRHRRRVAEAAALLLAARSLITFVPFEKWRGLLGQRLDGPDGANGSDPALLKPLLDAHKRALARLPFEFDCLPSAMALHWMLRRRGIASVLSIGALPKQGRGSIDDLHAWVSVNGTIRLGERPQTYITLLRLG